MEKLFKPLVSIIVPVFNIEKYVEECVFSICKQSYKNIEIILVNDGSTDSSGEKCRKMANQDPRIIYIEKENGGLSSARNAGLDIIKGDLISFVDGDDVIDECFIEKLYDGIVTFCCEMSVCEYVTFSDKAPIDTGINKSKSLVIKANDYWTYKFRRGNGAVMCNKMFKKHLFDSVRFPNNKINEDEFVIHYLVDESNKIFITTEQLYFYRTRSGSITQKGFSIKNLDAIEAFLDRNDYFLEKDKVENAYIAICNAFYNFVAAHYYKNTINDSYRRRIKELRAECINGIKRYKHKRIGFRKRMRFLIFRCSIRLYKIIFNVEVKQ